MTTVAQLCDLPVDDIQQLSFRDIKQMLTKDLKSYARSLERIAVLQDTRNLGNDISIDLQISQIDDAPDQLSLVHRRLKNLNEEEYLTDHERDLAITYRSYNFNKRHSLALSSKTRELHRALREPDEITQGDDREKLRELNSKFMHVVGSRNRNLTYRQRMSDPTIREELEIQNLRKEYMQIECALQRLFKLKPTHERLLRLRWIDKKSVSETAIELHICERTYERWRDDAFEYLAVLLYGYRR